MSAKPQKPEYLDLDPAVLTVHPALSAQPEWADDDQEFEAFIRDIAERGFDVRLKIDSRNRVVDGRQRLRAAKRLKLTEVPCERVADQNVNHLILHYILQRRHYTKGARAYMTVPFIADDKRSLEIIAQQFGLKRQILQQAIEVHQLFNREGKYKSEPADLIAAFKAEVEPTIIAGDIGLGGVFSGWEGFRCTVGKKKSIRTAIDLWERSFNTLKARFNTWDKFDTQTKAGITAHLNPFLESMPDELLTKLSQRATAEIKERLKNK